MASVGVYLLLVPFVFKTKWVSGAWRPRAGVGITKEFSRSFYQSSAWKQSREAFLKSKRNLCERCLDNGLFVPAKVVHHKVLLTPDNINDPNITLNWENLKAVCQGCHAEEHKRKKRYTVAEDGSVIVNQEPT